MKISKEMVTVRPAVSFGAVGYTGNFLEPQAEFSITISNYRYQSCVKTE